MQHMMNVSQSLAFVLVVLNCQDVSPIPIGECKPLYPNTLFFAVRRSTALCPNNTDINIGNESADWFWWVLIAYCIFINICMVSI